MPITQPEKKKIYLVTDSTDIVLNNYDTSGYNNVGAAFNAVIPASGIIKLSALAGRLLNDATAALHNAHFGVRVNSVNYWFGYSNNNGTVGVSASMSGNSTASAYKEYNGTASNPAQSIDVAAYGVATGLQSIQLIAAYTTAASTLKGTVKQTRAIIEILDI